jgi:hypothetical protein
MLGIVYNVSMFHLILFRYLSDDFEQQRGD